MQPLKIGELARRAGVSHRTIHYYEDMGLIAPLDREGASHRTYADEAVARLDKVAALKRLGLSLDEIASVIDLYFGGDGGPLAGKQKVIEIMKGHLARVDTQLAELDKFRAELCANIAHLEALCNELRAT